MTAAPLRILPFALGLLTAMPAAPASPAERQELAGAFVTMTAGARCPSVSTIAVQAQGEATGPIEGLFDFRGSMDIDVDARRTGVTVRAFTAALDFNQHRIPGTLRWDAADPPMRLVCDALSLRLEGTVRYTVGATEQGLAEIEAYGSRSAVTMPYYGRTTLRFIPAAAPVR